MPTMWRKAMLYLGLAPEEDYDDYDAAYDDDYVEAAPARRGAPTVGGVAEVAEPSAIGAVRAIRTVDSPTVTEPPPIIPTPRPQVVRPIPVASNAKPHVVTPISFNEAQEVADKFKGNQPVIMNLQGADRDLARRLIDFASGLCYGVGGQMEKVANQVYLLSPSNVEVSVEERRRLQERGFSDR